jgi:probable FeS assembly SUF system protein SufT
MPYIETELKRDCQAIRIPEGIPVSLPAGTPVVITQALGNTYTVQAPTIGGLYRIDGTDADAIGQKPPESKEAAPRLDGHGPVDEKLIWEQLRTVYDPEIPVNIVELGLVYDLCIEALPDGGNRVHIIMTLTAPGCGMGPVIAMDAKSKVESVAGVVEADVEIVFDPTWSQQMMSEAAKLELGMF